MSALLAQPLKRGLSIGVAGCGPGGLTAALFLHRAGHRVTLYDQFAAPKPLGSGLIVQPSGLAVLRKLGLEEDLVARGEKLQQLTGWSVAQGSSKMRALALDVDYTSLKGGAFAVGIHRSGIFDLLHNAVLREGIEIVSDFRVAQRSYCEHSIRLLGAATAQVSAAHDLVVDALGSHTPFANDSLRSTLNYGAFYTDVDRPAAYKGARNALEQRYVAAHTMVGVLPIGGDRVTLFFSVKKEQVNAVRAKGIDAFKASALLIWPDLQPLLDQITSFEQLIFATYEHRTESRPFSTKDTERDIAMVKIGDAYHSTSPQLGQGCNMALLDACSLSAQLEAGAHATVGDALAAYGRKRHSHVLAYQTLSYLFTPLYQSDSSVLPLLRDLVVRPASVLGINRALLARMVSGWIVD